MIIDIGPGSVSSWRAGHDQMDLPQIAHDGFGGAV